MYVCMLADLSYPVRCNPEALSCPCHLPSAPQSSASPPDIYPNIYTKIAYYTCMYLSIYTYIHYLLQQTKTKKQNKTQKKKKIHPNHNKIK